MSDKTREMASRVLAFIETNPDAFNMNAWVNGFDRGDVLRPGDAVPEGVTMCVGTIAARLDGSTLSFDRDMWSWIATQGGDVDRDLAYAGRLALDIEGWYGHTPHLFVTDNRSALKTLAALAAGVEYSDAMAQQIESAEFAPVRTADDH